MRVCLDTHVVIWGIKGEAPEGRQNMVARAKSFIMHLDEEGADVIIPAVVVAECLAKVPPDRIAPAVEVLTSSFRIVPFDLIAAEKYAFISQTLRGDERGETSHEKMKTNIMIIAISIAHGVDVIYSHDPHLKQIANGIIAVHEVPEILRQGNIDF